MSQTSLQILRYPLNKKFAFSIVDDTDDATLEKVKKAYAFLDELGIKATKTVWVFPSTRKSGDDTTGKWCEGVTLADSGYLLFIKNLATRGHEISLHTASGGNNLREDTLRAYEFFKRELGFYPVMNIMHGRNRDNLYYGKEAFKGIFRLLASLYSADTFEGHSPQSPFYWGDILSNRSRYVRFYKSMTLNTLRINPSMPYHDPAKPLVPRWFSSTDLSSLETIRQNLTTLSLERLMHEEGVCIGYTYFQYYLDPSLKMHPLIEERFRLLDKYRHHVWFTPASPLLDRLEQTKNLHLKNHRGKTMLLNYSDKAIEDVWVRGPAGTRLYLENGEQLLIGPSGTGHCIKITPCENKNAVPQIPRLRPGEELRMIISQLYLLLFRHLSGRPLRRKGF